jgi:hypothetical protein
LSKSILSLLLALAFSATVDAQYWQQAVDYRMDVSLNDQQHSLDGFANITYTNNSPDTLFFIWFHIWPNAFKNDKTAFSEQLLRNGRTDFYFSSREERGYINRLDFKADGVTAQTADHPQYIDIIKLVLPKPLLPGAQTTIQTPFHVQLPKNFSRGGHSGQAYQLTQWFPKPAVYDAKGWHPMPYLDQGEFYSEFGDYDVRITVPENYVVAATGELQDDAEKEWLKNRAAYHWEPVVTKTSVKKGSYKQVKKTVQAFPASATTTKTLRFIQQHVVDFAWFADKRFIVNHDTLQLPSGKIIGAWSYYLPGTNSPWKNSTDFIKNAVRFRSTAMGAYPYNTVSAVEAVMGVQGGMEYPTITSISPVSGAAELEGTIEHEIGHNWLQGILASNERDYPWMDEGMNTYYDNRYATSTKKPAVKKSNRFLYQRMPDDVIPVLLQSVIAVQKDQPISTAAADFTYLNTALVAYYKTGLWMKKLEEALGLPLFDSCMKIYFTGWQFKHPYPEDFKKIINDLSGSTADTLFSWLNTKGALPPTPVRTKKMVAFFNFTQTDKYSYINILPAIGYNHYDKFMLGAMVHNYQFPAERFQFLLAPLYATGSKKINYLARASYSWYPVQHFYKIALGAAIASFSADAFQPADASNIILGFRKLAPFVKLNFKENNPHSKITRYIQFTPFFIQENGLNFKTVITGPDTSDVVDKTSSSRYLNQLKLVIDNRRILYPYHAQLLAEQANGFVRLAFTGNYYFNYAGDKGGMRIRFFAGKFFYTGARTISKQFETDRYQLNMTGANGYEDYTYGSYFVGRNEFEGLGNRQLMIRDGGFKVRTDLLSSKIGKTDNWLSAVNLVTDISNKKIPLKLFADIGTYAGAWQANAQSSRFLFDAGLQLSLFKETINIYLPIVYSAAYRDYFKSTLGKNYFFKTISFSIDIQHFRLGKINQHLEF